MVSVQMRINANHQKIQTQCLQNKTKIKSPPNIRLRSDIFYIVDRFTFTGFLSMINDVK